uniref:Fibronectin type-III domain-containing protein n=1 Tax=Strigamia maritima TaxID=126957 RepID=T1JLW3_STRMM
MEPKAEEVVVPNSTWLALNLHQWPDGGCPILYFVIKYKPASKEDWVLVSNNVQPHQQHILISELQPGAAYHMQVTAHNDAGSTVANFGTKTLTPEGEMAADAVSHDLPFFYDWSIISIITVSALVIATVFLFAIYFFVRKRKYRGYRHNPVIEGKLATEQQHTKTVLENGTNIVEMTYNPSARKYSLPGTCTLNTTDYNTIPRDGYPESINPYATFNVPGCQAALMQDVQRPTAIPSAMDEAERNYSQQLHPATNKSPFDLYSRVVKRIDNANPEETNQRNG